jgi:hypothetical protein
MLYRQKEEEKDVMEDGGKREGVKFYNLKIKS